MENTFTQFHNAWIIVREGKKKSHLTFHTNCTHGLECRRKIGACGSLARSYIIDYLSGEGSKPRRCDHALKGSPSGNSGEAADAIKGSGVRRSG
jgi:hypothetical protein